MRSLFKTLYCGDYSPGEAPLSAETKKKLEACDPYYDKVIEQLGKDFFHEMWDAQMDADMDAILSAYAAGVRFGGRFMLELLSDSEADT
ncbi:MAG: hypothetical protein HFF18_07640 [Oscillospiraceae bacterium]|nr:hypothetical protein [Oscillospiraceae bacterium]